MNTNYDSPRGAPPGEPSPFTWIDRPTLRLDDRGRAIAAERVERGRCGNVDVRPNFDQRPEEP